MQDSAEAGGGVTIGGTYNNEVTVALRPASIAPGQVECELQIYSDENKTTLITTAKFNFECQRAIFNEDTAMATNEYPLLVSLISVCNGIVAAEELRVTAEQSRVAAENIRNDNEVIRNQEELDRKAAETQRDNAEAVRVSNESTRIENENLRKGAENNRALAEGERVTAENNRATAETARDTAEKNRATAETGRANAETLRVNAEEKRMLEFAKWLAANATAETLSAGSPATVTLTEVSGAKRFTFGIPKGADGNGTGDMSKSTYDKDGDGIVDKAADADKLGGKAASEYQPAGTYATPGDVSGAVSGHNSASNAHSALFTKKQNVPALASSLPASGAALTANTIYNVSSPVGTYVFTPPASGWAHGTFSTAASVAVSFVSGANYLGEAPAIEASKTYEFDVYNGVWAVQEVVSA